MPLITTTPESPHWYAQDGTPMHSATLRDARKKMLFPSVTSVLSLWPKPALDNYKIEQAVLAALTLPPLPLETPDTLAKRVILDAEEHRKSAALFGRKLHSVCEKVSGRQSLEAIVPPDPIYAFIPNIELWFEENILRVLSTERVVVSLEHGYAGTYDLLAVTKHWGTALIDFKTQGVKKGDAKFYETWDFQLAAYFHPINQGLPGLIENLVSVVIDSAAPGMPVSKVWNMDTRPDAFRKFMACLTLWKESRNYWPVCLALTNNSDGTSP